MYKDEIIKTIERLYADNQYLREALVEMKEINVYSQKDLDEIERDFIGRINIYGGDWCSPIIVRGAWANSTAVAWENSSVVACGNSTVKACDNSTAVACENSCVEAYDNSTAVAWENGTSGGYRYRHRRSVRSWASCFNSRFRTTQLRK